MLEYVFRKEALKKLIEDSAEDKDEVLIRLSFSPGKDGVFPARVTARCQRTGDTGDLTDEEISGCPRPPGCD